MNANLNVAPALPRCARILVLDPDPETASKVQPADPNHRYDIRQLTRSQDTPAALEGFRPDVIILAADWCEGSMAAKIEMSHRGRGAASLSGIGERLQALRQSDRNVAIVLLVDQASASADLAIELSALGAGECVAKPIFAPALSARLASILEARQMLRTPSISCHPAAGEPMTAPIVGRSEAMLAMYRAIGIAAKRSAAVLICGESGAGKTVAALAVHRHSGRPFENFQFIRGDECSADTVLEGLTNAASPTTIILEDVDRVSPLVQRQWLDWIRAQPRSINPDQVGPQSALVMTVQTSPGQCDPISTGLRRDLFFELCGGRIEVPALRERGGDIELLIDHFVSCFTQAQSIDGGGHPRMEPAALKMLCRYAWPGNVSELQSVLWGCLHSSRGVIVANEFLQKATRQVSRSPTVSIAAIARSISGGSIDASPTQAASEQPVLNTMPHTQLRTPDYWTAAVQDLVERAGRDGAGPDGAGPDVQPGEGQAAPARSGIPSAQTSVGYSVHTETVEAVETGLIGAVLKQTGGNLTHSARLLGITRVSLRKKIHTLGLVIPGRGVST